MTLLLELAYYVLYDGTYPVAPYMHHILCDYDYMMYGLCDCLRYEKLWIMLTVDCLRYEKLWMMLTVICLCYEKIVDLLVLYAMKMLIDARITRSNIEPCHEMLMELERIFTLCDMPCNVRNVYVMLAMFR